MDLHSSPHAVLRGPTRLLQPKMRTLLRGRPERPPQRLRCVLRLAASVPRLAPLPVQLVPLLAQLVAGLAVLPVVKPILTSVPVLRRVQQPALHHMLRLVAQLSHMQVWDLFLQSASQPVPRQGSKLLGGGHHAGGLIPRRSAS
mmetsp:Transcript_18595/g.59083  ORF Transcript_18595/g.59083 Transcript_18595/m.59083 type:complete len:144 (-) Transcript_18595:324-755(-)